MYADFEYIETIVLTDYRTTRPPTTAERQRAFWLYTRLMLAEITGQQSAYDGEPVAAFYNEFSFGTGRR